MDATIRPIRAEELPLLTEFLYEAIFQREGSPPLPRMIIQAPSLWAYISGFGSREDDHCLVAEVGGAIVGAVWVRCVRAHGYVDDATPELAVSLYPSFRAKGIGSRLMREMLRFLHDTGYMRVSLAVQKDNYAVGMYRKLGFGIVRENAEDYVMVCNLT